MFSHDILSLRKFYATAFGESVRTVVASAIYKFWATANGDVVLGLGYATPYVKPYLEQAKPLVVCMPAQQGAEYWPDDGDNLVTLAHDSELPFAQNSVNRVLLVHSIENSEQLSLMIEEVWRILTPSGKLLAVVPNRLSLWSRSSRSPFGYGRPFSIAQMRDLLTEQNFTITRTRSALFMPPVRIKCLWKWVSRFEKFAEFFSRFIGIFFGGVLLVEAEKQIYSAIRQPVVEARQYRSSLAGARAAVRVCS